MNKKEYDFQRMVHAFNHERIENVNNKFLLPELNGILKKCGIPNTSNAMRAIFIGHNLFARTNDHKYIIGGELSVKELVGIFDTYRDRTSKSAGDNSEQKIAKTAVVEQQKSTLLEIVIGVLTDEKDVSVELSTNISDRDLAIKIVKDLGGKIYKITKVEI